MTVREYVKRIIRQEQEKEQAKNSPFSRLYLGLKPVDWANRAVIGAGFGAGMHTIGSYIEGGKALETAWSPRTLARNAAVGAVFGTAVPAVTAYADRLTRKKESGEG